MLETRLSGISDLPFGAFLLLMQPIHLAIGIVEGLVTAALVAFVWQARPEILALAAETEAEGARSLKPVLIALVVAALVTGGMLSWFASAHPDGLEWALFRTTGKEELAAPGGGAHESLARLQERTAFLPDYGFKESREGEAAAEEPAQGAEAWPAVSAGTSVSGLVGGAMVLLLAGATGLVLRGFRRRPEPE